MSARVFPGKFNRVGELRHGCGQPEPIGWGPRVYNRGKKMVRLGKMVLLANGLSCNHKDLTLDPQNQVKKSVILVMAGWGLKTDGQMDPWAGLTDQSLLGDPD